MCVCRSSVSLRLQTNPALREEALLQEEAERAGLLLQKYRQQLLDLLATVQSSRTRFRKTLLSFAEVEKKMQAAQTLARLQGEQRRRRRKARQDRVQRDKETDRNGQGHYLNDKDKDKDKDKGDDAVNGDDGDGDGGDGGGDGGDIIEDEQVELAFLPGEIKENWMVRFINATAIGSAFL